MKLFLRKLSVLVLGFFILASVIAFVGFWSLRQSNFYKPSFLVNSVDQDQFDYIILGASNGLTTLNTKVIDSMLLTEGINLSMDDTAVSSQYLMLQHFLAQGKRTKYCILASSPFSYDFKHNTINDNDYRFLMYVNRPYVSEYYKQFPGRRAKILYNTKWMPAIGMAYYNAELFYPSMMSVFKPKKRNRFDEKGNYSYPMNNYEDKTFTKTEAAEIKMSNEYIKKIKELCEANSIELICYISPIKTKKAIVDSSVYTIINHGNTLQNSKYFHDEIHVNTLGRKASSINFAKAFSILAKTNEH